MKKIFVLVLLEILLACSFHVSFASDLEQDYKYFLSEKKVGIEEKDEKDKKPPEIIDESQYKPIHLGKLLNEPAIYIGKKIRFTGEFSSFATLALDYKPALRDSKEFISFCIFRPHTKIPLSELKLAYPVEKAKDNEVVANLGKGDTIEIFGDVFSSALDEPWIDVTSIKVIKSVPKEKDDLLADIESEENSKVGGKDSKQKNNKNKPGGK